MQQFSIAIDGPSGAGKSTVANSLAKRLGVLHLDTGAMYRAFAWQAQQEGLSTMDEAAMASLAGTAHIQVRFEAGQQHTLINGKDVTGEIRTPEVSMGASNCSTFEAVRSLMVESQQALAQSCNMVLDGRDIGTKVLPHATIKVFLTASPEVRAQRRHQELAAKGEASTYQQVLAEVWQRDEQDSTRAIDPLRPAEDALVVDTSALTEEQVVEKLEALVRQRLAKGQKETFTFTYHLARGLSWLLFHTLFPVTYHDVDNAQLDAPYILIANHNSMIDPLVVGWKCSRYQIRFFGKKELTRVPLLRKLFYSLRMIPVDRYHTDMTAVRSCLKTLQEDHVLGLFPEGTRHKEGLMEDLEGGIALIALRAQTPLLPVYMTGKPRLFRRIHCYYGKPMDISQLADAGVSKSTIDALLERIRQTYRHMAASVEKAKKDG